MYEKLNTILKFDNKHIDSSIIHFEQVRGLVIYLLDTIVNGVEGDVTEFGCYVGESSKYLMKTLIETGSDKKLYVYDSFEGLPDLSKWEENTGWRAGTLKTTQETLIQNFEQNNLPSPIIHKDWFKNVPEDKLPEKIAFAFLDGDFYDSIYDSLTKVFDRVSDGGYICFHDYKRNDLPGVHAAISDFLSERGLPYTVTEICDQLGVYKKISNVQRVTTPIIKNEPESKAEVPSEVKNGGVTIVTGIWDLKRDTLTEGWGRPFDHYLTRLAELMKTDDNMIIYIEEKYKSFVEQHRKPENTLIVVKELDWFKSNGAYYDLIQKIRTNPDWYNQVGWLTESTQAKLDMYNPMVMSKMFLLNDATIFDPFNSSHLVWVDGGLTTTVHEGYFWKDGVIANLKDYFKKFSFVCFPYDGKQEIHGFKYDMMCYYAGAEVDKVARGGIFGGPKETIRRANEIYYALLYETLGNGLMGTEESLFTIMVYKYPELFQYFEIEYTGLVGTFFENLKDKTLKPKVESTTDRAINEHNTDNVALYVLTFNLPEQFSKLCRSFNQYDKNFLDKPKKFLIDNSTDDGTYSEYKSLCEYYGFTHLKMKDNLGICGGRQFIAEHAEENGFDYHMFFEDDMFFYLGEDQYCRNGFARKIPDFYNKVMQIAWNENFDFLKFNFSEFFGDNSRQWSWHNVPQDFREKHFPEKPRKTSNDTNTEPFLKFKNIKSYNGLPYATGEIYYCNWPQVVSREGNKRMFLDTKWAHPFEQTWMSYIFQETIKNKIYPGILLATPTEHNRFMFYSAEERKEC